MALPERIYKIISDGRSCDCRRGVRKILAHLGLPTRPLPLSPARREAEIELPFGPRSVAVESEAPPDVDQLPAWMRAVVPDGRELPVFNDADLVDEPIDPSRLPGWMRAVPDPHRLRARVDREHIDEPVRMERLPAWMRSARASRGRRRKPRWSRRTQRRSAQELGFWPDEPILLERLPQWMRAGSFFGPGPPEWEYADAPGPGVEAFVDPVYDEP